MMIVIELGDIYHRRVVRQNLQQSSEDDLYSSFNWLNSGSHKKYSIWSTSRTVLHQNFIMKLSLTNWRLADQPYGLNQ